MRMNDEVSCANARIGVRKLFGEGDTIRMCPKSQGSCHDKGWGDCSQTKLKSLVPPQKMDVLNNFIATKFHPIFGII